MTNWPSWLEGYQILNTPEERFLLWLESRVFCIKINPFLDNCGVMNKLIRRGYKRTYTEYQTNTVVYTTLWRSRLIRLLRWLRHTSLETRTNDPLWEMSFKREDYQ